MLVVVGGHTRNIGKTSVVAGLIRALPELRLDRLEITQYGHGVCSSEGEPCECAVHGSRTSLAVSRGTRSAPAAPTAAGFSPRARSAPTGCAPQPVNSGHALPDCAESWKQAPTPLSNRTASCNFSDRIVYLAVMDFAVRDFKQTSLTTWIAPMLWSLSTGRRANPVVSGVRKNYGIPSGGSASSRLSTSRRPWRRLVRGRANSSPRLQGAAPRTALRKRRNAPDRKKYGRSVSNPSRRI